MTAPHAHIVVTIQPAMHTPDKDFPTVNDDAISVGRGLVRRLRQAGFSIDDANEESPTGPDDIGGYVIDFTTSTAEETARAEQLIDEATDSYDLEIDVGIAEREAAGSEREAR